MRWYKPFAKFAKQAPIASSASHFEIQTQASYLITGGLGELGLLSARWLVQQGVKYLILIGRSSLPRPEAQAVINELQAQGAQIKVLSLDLSDAAAVSQSFQDLRLNSLPIRGVIHAAGVLNDSLIANQNLESLQKVLAPKVAGSWNLHLATLADPLDFFICYSSITATLGMPGQSNYAAANCFLDALVQYRRGLGLPALSINWGPWHRPELLANQDIQNKGNQRLMLSQYGFSWLTPEQGLDFLNEVLKMQISQAGVMGVDIRQLTQSLPQTRHLPILNHIARSQAFELELKQPQFKSRRIELPIISLPDIDFALSESGQVQAITRLNPRAELPSPQELEGFLVQQIARILGINTSEINTQTSLRIYGFDSLMALELKAQVQQSYELNLKASERFQSMTISEMAERLLQNN